MANPSSRDTAPSAGSLIDELSNQLDTTRRLLTSNPDDVATRALQLLEPDSGLEARVAASLASPPLADPTSFAPAHRLVVRALEVLHRESGRPVPVSRRYRLLRPVARIVATFVAAYIVRRYANAVANSLANLYARREAQCPPRSPERSSLALARADMQRLAPGFSGKLGIPALLAGGAIVPILASAVQYLGAIDFLSPPVIGAVFTGLILLFLFLSSLLLAGARHAHRRAVIVMREPLQELWQTLGHADEPPQDNARIFAIIAIVLTGAVWLAVPAAAALLYLAI